MITTKSICLPVDENLDCSQLEAMNKDVINSLVPVFCRLLFSFLLNKYQYLEISESQGKYVPNFVRNCWFSRIVIPFYMFPILYLSDGQLCGMPFNEFIGYLPELFSLALSVCVVLLLLVD